MSGELLVAGVIGAASAVFGGMAFLARRLYRAEKKEELPRGKSWRSEEASSRIRLATAFAMWATASTLFAGELLRTFGWTYGEIATPLYLFFVLVLPVGLGLVVARMGSGLLLRDRPAPPPAPPPAKTSGARKVSWPVPPDIKRYESQDIMPSGFPATYKGYIPPKSSAVLQEEYIQRSKSRSLARLEAWKSAQFSFQNVLGV